MKISNKFASASAVALLALSTSAPVLATTSTTPQNATSNGRVELTTSPDTDHPGDGDDGGDGEDPTDPSDPNYPNDGNGNDNTGNKGDFTLDVVPNYDFGIHEITDDPATYPALFWDATAGAVVDGRNSNPYVQVTDLRANNTGWHVTVAMTKDFQTAEGKKLNGAVLSLPMVSDKSTPATAGNVSTAPSNFAVASVSSAESTLMSAEDGAGVGTWMDIMFDNKDNNTKPTELAVPSGNSAGKYQADLTWTLSDAPQA